MMNNKLNIVVVLGTTREGRQSETAAKYVAERVTRRPDMEVTFFDVRDLVYDGMDEGEQIKEQNAAWRDMVIAADGLVIVTPEYNHGYPGSLKLALDTLLKEYIHKAVALVGVSSGGLGGARVVELLIPVVRELGLVVTFTSLYVSKSKEAFDADGNPTDPAMDEQADAMLEELAWMARVLKWGRANVPSRYHE